VGADTALSPTQKPLPPGPTPHLPLVDGELIVMVATMKRQREVERGWRIWLLEVAGGRDREPSVFDNQAGSVNTATLLSPSRK